MTKELILGPLSNQGKDSDKLWAECSEKIYRLNNLEPSMTEEKQELLENLFGEFGADSQLLTPFSCNLGYTTKIGKGCFINTGAVFLDPDTIEIGDYTLLGPGVHIYTANHPVETSKRIVQKEDGEYTFTNFTEPVKIGSRCWIGGNSIILPGVTIGDNVVVGAGSIVTSDIPSNSVAVGSPAKVIRENR